MNTTNIVILSALITVGGQWAQGKPLSARIGVGGVFAALGLAALSGANAGLAQDLALLILVTSIIFNGPALFDSIGKATK